jgi:hypothetical protein
VYRTCSGVLYLHLHQLLVVERALVVNESEYTLDLAFATNCGLVYFTALIVDELLVIALGTAEARHSGGSKRT